MNKFICGVLTLKKMKRIINTLLTISNCIVLLFIDAKITVMLLSVSFWVNDGVYCIRQGPQPGDHAIWGVIKRWTWEGNTYFFVFFSHTVIKALRTGMPISSSATLFQTEMSHQLLDGLAWNFRERHSCSSGSLISLGSLIADNRGYLPRMQEQLKKANIEWMTEWIGHNDWHHNLCFTQITLSIMGNALPKPETLQQEIRRKTLWIHVLTAMVSCKMSH